jgi:uncharacterized protein
VLFLFSRLFFLFILLLSNILLTGCNSTRVNAPAPVSLQGNQFQSGSPQIIALLLPLQGQLGSIGQTVKQGFLAAARESHTQPQIIIIDTTKETPIQAAYQKAVTQNAQFVVGPLLKPQVQNVASLQLSTRVLALNYLNPDISTPAELYQFGLSPRDEARQAAIKAWQSGYRSAVIMAVDNHWGSQVAQAFADAWNNLGGNIVDRLALGQNSAALTQQVSHFLDFKPPHERRHDFDVIFLASDATMGRQVKPLLRFFYAGDIPVYATAAIYTGLSNSRLDNDLNDIIFCSAPWALGSNTPQPMLYEQLQAAYAPEFFRRRSYYALGVDAFHIIQQLPRLTQSSSQILEGATGQLTLNTQRRIVRQLPCAQFLRGQVVLLNA